MNNRQAILFRESVQVVSGEIIKALGYFPAKGRHHFGRAKSL